MASRKAKPEASGLPGQASSPSARRRRKAADAGTRGLGAAALAAGEAPAAVQALGREIEADGGAVLAAYREPLGGAWQILAALPVERVEPTPFQRDLSAPHVEQLARAMERLNRYLDPIVAVRAPGGGWWTPNGNHRLAALKRLGAGAVVALVLPEPEMAFQILALNTEKAHNLREKCLEVIRMARELARLDPRPEAELGDLFQEPAFLTLGCCYEERPRFSGSVYNPVLKRVEDFLAVPMPAALEERRRRAAVLFALDEAVAAAAAALRERGLESPFLKVFVLARVNPLRFQRGARAGFDETLEKMTAAARSFDPSKVGPEHLAGASGLPEE